MTELNQLLLTVQKPARYIGGEWNAVRKEWNAGTVKVLLAFPDVYEVGMSYLGQKILYGILNEREDCLCERVFSPWPDFEDVLRKNDISLFSLESRKPIKEFDIIGFSLAYELNYTNALNILDLGGIPKKSSERTNGDPLIIAGGPSCYNPEPMAEFIDAFVIGDGEEAIGDVIDTYKRTQYAVRSTRYELLKELAKIEGVYVPSLYEVNYNDDGTIKKFSPLSGQAPERIKKRILKDIENSYYPTKQLVPYIQIVHDRIALEIMRGCVHNCRFCQAGTTYRPCRQRSEERVMRLAEESYGTTGYEELSLLSLSSGDHPKIKEIIKGLNRIFEGKAVSISVPSLRIEDILGDLPELISRVKKTGLTFAPEAGSECLRKRVNKNIDIEKLYEAVLKSFHSGWRRIKLYFMIGLPAENDEDLTAIGELVKKISDLKKNIDGRPGHVTASINAFVPKPHTSFQWEAMASMEELGRKKGILLGSVRSRNIELDFHPFERGFVEAIFSRGDRRLSEAIYNAWRSGCRFDGWRDFFNFGAWMNSFKNSGIDPFFYAYRKRSGDEILPWDFVDIGIGKDYFLKEAKTAGNTAV
ncbi:MAG: TIGR03960 family B12-binding radical SAM protein [Candidatus Omnitrophica bacterium]|nr:TIGR03960 family B12-binding radical SAM protein [Candidatus Omnitrophota bacterium]